MKKRRREDSFLDVQIAVARAHERMFGKTFTMREVMNRERRSALAQKKRE